MNQPIDLRLGDAFKIMLDLPPNHFDAFVGDPPYGIRFMGKAWDGKDIAARTAGRAQYSTDPDPKSGQTGGHRSIAAEAGKYARDINASWAFEEWTRTWAFQAFRILKPGAYLVCFGSTRTYHRLACGIEDAGFEIRDQLAWVFGSGFPKSKNLGKGRGTALKPGWEPICLARKPIVGSNLEANLAAHGTGGLNIDDCRIPFASAADEAEAKEKNRHADFESGPMTNKIFGKFHKDRDNYGAAGRWPGNLAHDGSDEVIECFPQSESIGHFPAKRGAAGMWSGEGGGLNGNSGPEMHTDVGSVSRFFYCAKTSRAERDAGLEHFAHKPLNWSSGTQSPGTFQGEGTVKAVRNNHPTVKPIALMRWLVRLVCPVGGTVLDPMMGSGTTGIACVHEDRGFTGIEREPEYFDIAKARIDHARGSLFTHVSL